MSDGDGVKRVKSREFTGISPLQLAGTGVKLVKTRVVFVGNDVLHSNNDYHHHYHCNHQHHHRPVVVNELFYFILFSV